ncbi:ABC transporter substrate-binding protein [Paenibacillus ginsengarvi]|uniref:ABC transporter substrate-binding protein n=1 Tax=Paenibacillus ginsengarvi TaxID=400777 RepID=UPI00187570F3|nr:extracellular solute-binding protein [Paenibacillus ginsengarvi]
MARSTGGQHSAACRRIRLAALPLVVAVGLTACSANNGQQADQGGKPNVPEVRTDEPAELVFHSNNGDPEDAFNSLFGNALRKKFPKYTIKYIQQKAGQTLPELLAQNQTIDILFASAPYIFGLLMDSELQYDMTDLIKKQGVDLNKFEPTLIDGIRASGDGKMYALPVTNMVQVMYYNQSLFDKFGVAYPKNGMTWDEAMDISRKLTRKDEGKQMLGFASSPAHILRGNQLSQPYLDPATDKPTFQNDVWRSLIQLFFADPGSDEGYKSRVSGLNRLPTWREFTDTQEIGMFVYNSQFPFTVPNDIGKVQWDLVSLPVLKEKPKVGSAATPFAMAVTSISKNKEAAIKAIDYLVSRDNQLDYSRRGIMPVINDEEVKKAYGKESDFKDKNWSAVFYNQYAPMAKFSRYHLKVENILNTVPLDVMLGRKDLNTALREAAEAAEKTITEVKRGR